MSSVKSAQPINYTALTPCSITFPDGYGVRCNGGCNHTAYWCNDKTVEYCQDSRVLRNDPRLCSHPTFWEDISCNYVVDTYLGKKIVGEHTYPGLRCTGTIKHCYYPQGSPPRENFPTTCRDKSDRVFQVGEPCPDTPDNICWESCDTPGPGCIVDYTDVVRYRRNDVFWVP